MQTGMIQPYIQTQGFPPSQTNSAKAESDFSQKVMTCVSAGSQNVMLRSDALMSYASPQTGESVNIYRSDRYTKENPIYLLKGLDAAGQEFSYEVDASDIDPNHCSYNEMMVLNVETGSNTPENYLHAVMMRDKAGVSSYFEQADYLSAGKSVLSDFRTLGAWDSYLSFDKWLQNLLAYTGKKIEDSHMPWRK